MPEDHSGGSSEDRHQNSADRGPADGAGAEGSAEGNPAAGGSPAAGEHRSTPGERRESRPDIRAAKTETTVRRWALLLLVLIPAAYFVIQKVLS